MDSFLLIVYFVYGLAFFGMGLALALEAGRSPALAESRLLWPLAIFGLIHGAHEWLEIFVLQAVWLGAALPSAIGWLRIGLLFASFVALLAYGLHSYRAPGPRYRLLANVFLIALLVYLLGIVCSAISTYAGQVADVDIARLVDTLIRYLLAVPGAILAAFGLRGQARIALAAGRTTVARALITAAIAFGLYGLTQIFVPAMEMPPARLINADAFRAWTGLPVQALRSLLALTITIGMIRAMQAVERERQAKIMNDVHERESLRRELLRHTVHAQEDERARIARELHDETSQVLAAFSLDLGTLQNSLPQRSPLRPLVERLQNHSRQISQGLYRMVRDLRPAQLDDLGLIPALKYLADAELLSNGLTVDLQIEGAARRIDPLLETVLFRVTQEAFTNILRHAGTTAACLRLTFEDRLIRLQVSDRGAGFNPDETFRPPRGWGLAGMRERLESVGGQLQVISSPGQGTTVIATIPLQETETN